MRRAAAAVAIAALLAAPAARPWGQNALRLITNKAVDALPAEMRPFFEANRNWLAERVEQPLETLAKSAGERKNYYIQFEKYGRFPFEQLPRDYNAAVRKFTRKQIETHGTLPWQVGVYSEKLTNAFKAHNWEDVRENAAILGFFVAEAHDPFRTTDNADGTLSGQPGVDKRFGKTLVEKYSLFFFVRPNDAVFISDPTDRAFEICLTAHGWIENILLADVRAKQGLKTYSNEYYDRFYNQAGAILIRQLSDASTDVASFWMTAWVNGGRPSLPGR